VHVDEVPLLVDTGTSTYEPGQVRRYERSTAAHSTVQVDAADSTEVWGVFRAGRRARVSGVAVHADDARITCEAVHDGFRGLRGRPVHHRRWSLSKDGLQVEDLVTGRGRHEIVIRWQLATGTTVQVADRSALVTSPAGDFSVTVAATAPVRLSAETRAVAAGFASTADAPVLTCRLDARLAVGVTTVWNRARGSAVGERAT
jgi:Heparinase II/III-like protein